jgi:hypothetical protein
MPTVDARELVPPDSFKYCKSRGLNPLILLDQRIIKIYATIKSKFPKAICNNWHLGGKYSQSGYRNDGSGAPVSQHRFGRALDIHGVDPRVLYNHLLKWRLLSYRDITAIESLSDTPSWVHIDVRYSPSGFQIVRG